jgi:hypothetical protein
MVGIFTLHSKLLKISKLIVNCDCSAGRISMDLIGLSQARPFENTGSATGGKQTSLFTLPG